MIDWDYLKRLLCERTKELYAKYAGYDECLEGGALKSLSDKCVALYVLVKLAGSGNCVFKNYKEFAEAVGLDHPVLRKIWRRAKGKRSAVYAAWLKDEAELMLFRSDAGSET